MVPDIGGGVCIARVSRSSSNNRWDGQQTGFLFLFFSRTSSTVFIIFFLSNSLINQVNHVTPALRASLREKKEKKRKDEALHSLSNLLWHSRANEVLTLDANTKPSDAQRDTVMRAVISPTLRVSVNIFLPFQTHLWKVVPPSWSKKM